MLKSPIVRVDHIQGDRSRRRARGGCRPDPTRPGSDRATALEGV